MHVLAGVRGAVPAQPAAARVRGAAPRAGALLRAAAPAAARARRRQAARARRGGAAHRAVRRLRSVLTTLLYTVYILIYLPIVFRIII